MKHQLSANSLVLNANCDQLRISLLELIVNHAYREGDFILSSGASSPYYINCKEVTLRAEGALMIGRLMLDRLPQHTDAIAGLTLGADPIVSAVSIVSAIYNQGIPGLIIRKQAKGHGTQAYIEGPKLDQSSHVVVLEDVVTTGKSALQAVARLQDAGYKVNQIISLVDRNQGGRELYQAKGLEFQALFTIEELQEYLTSS